LKLTLDKSEKGLIIKTSSKTDRQTMIASNEQETEMERKMYEMTENQIARFANKPTQDEIDQAIAEIRSGARDEALKTDWVKRHHGKTTGWGMGKAALILSLLDSTIEYQRGIWQGRVDRARGLPYAEERLEKSYNRGYNVGYIEYESNRRGWDKLTRENFDALYLS